MIKYGINDIKSPMSYIYNLKIGIDKLSLFLISLKINCLTIEETKKTKNNK